ncbi:hypothetical protein NDU88_009989 [Pleurodeles waltl]|uniref:Uncharacterized protein n=1 Tax=Pleurodeles waltl TaxID=8319 RepID=A0AAV7PUP5_PLEWA|nr:hypothetical protein NDU88_009989 [Pleurodeles waltl]
MPPIGARFNQAGPPHRGRRQGVLSAPPPLPQSGLRHRPRPKTDRLGPRGRVRQGLPALRPRVRSSLLPGLWASSNAASGPTGPLRDLQPSGSPRKARLSSLPAAHGSTRRPRRGPTPPAPRAHRQAPGLLSRAPTVSARPSASRGIQEAICRGHDAFSEARASAHAAILATPPPQAHIYWILKDSMANTNSLKDLGNTT